MKLENVVKIVNDKIETQVLSSSEYISTENMIANFGGVSFSSHIPPGKCTRFIKNDILISNIRPYFKKIWFARFDGGCSNDVIVIRNNNLIIPKYLYYAIANDNFVSYFNSSCKGTKMPRGNKDTLLEWKFEVPNIEIQQHIVNIVR